MNQEELLVYCKNITKEYGSNYYRATSLFPREVRDAVYVYYTWLRIPDEIVDSSTDVKNMASDLQKWIFQWVSLTQGERQDGVGIHSLFWGICQKYNVPLEYSYSFLRSMELDLHKKEYKTYDDLYEYIYGSACVVGLTLLHIFNLQKKELIPYATLLGEAMQLVNFLRDIQEDFELRQRVYIPLDDLHRFGVSVDDIARKNHSNNFRKLMQYEIKRCREKYKDAWVGIEKLPWRLKFPIRVATRNYEGVLQEIEKNDYNIWYQKHGLSKFKKIVIIIKSIFI